MEMYCSKLQKCIKHENEQHRKRHSKRRWVDENWAVDDTFQVHERTEDMDFLLLVIRKLLRTNSQSVKVG